MVEKVDLQRYEITGRLGSGADYDVRAAIDRETGAEVALKRPVPQAVSRKQHGAIEARTERLLAAYDVAGDAGGLLAPILGYTDAAVHDEFFGEELAEPYSVFVQGRASGIPLLGDMMSRITGVPIGAGQNLFAVFPLVHAGGHSPFPVHERLIDLEQHYLAAGFHSDGSQAPERFLPARDRRRTGNRHRRPGGRRRSGAQGPASPGRERRVP